MSDLTLVAEGRAFANGKYDLRSVDIIISNYTKIVDQSVTVLLGHRKLTPDQRKSLRYEVDIKPGSLKLFLEILLEHKEDLTALVMADPTSMTEAVAKLITEVIGFRRKFSEALSSGQKPKVVFNNGNYFDISNNSGTIIINSPSVLVAAEATRPSVDRLIRGVDGEEIKDLSLSHQEVETATITKDDIRITGSQKEELPGTIEVVGRLDTVSFSRHRGTIISGSSRYSVRWDEGLRGTIQKCVDVEGVIFTAKPVIDHRKVSDNTVGFHLLDCQCLQRDFFSQ